MTDAPRVTVERDGHVLLIGFNRPEKRNAADLQLLQELSLAYGELERDPELRAGFVFAHGDHFTGGLDLADVGPRIGPDGLDMVPEGGINPWQVSGEHITKPVVMAVQGTCLTLGIELMLASDIVVAADSTVFGQIEVARGILPFGGATIRFPRAVGWGNAIRWILTGDSFPVTEAYRIGLVQEVVPHGEQYARGLELAQRIAAQAPPRGAGCAGERPPGSARRGCRGRTLPSAQPGAARPERRRPDRHGGLRDPPAGSLHRTVALNGSRKSCPPMT
ncbi:MAG: crotonase/enoyl-CoA hydratase family protein [Rhodoglobus sp.]|nr:crotonase/enoyl-CoA hydratase family protein [Rhodoglobus sp.]